MLPKDLIKNITERVRKRTESPETRMPTVEMASKAALRKMMDALGEGNQEKYIQAYRELREIEAAANGDDT